MEKTADIMKYENTLPVNFDGVFRFTNWTEKDFVGKWGSKEYKFPARTTSPMFIPDQTPLEIQQIRKKFAKDLAQSVLGDTEEYKRLLTQEKNSDGSVRLNSIHQAGTYSDDLLAPLIQKCLQPLQTAQAVVSETPKVPLEDKLSKNEEGELNTKVVDKKLSLKQKAEAGQQF